MRNGDERENRIHLESSRNGFIAYTFATMAVWTYTMIYMDEVYWSLYLMAIGPLMIFVVSMIYYHWKGLKNSVSLSSLRSD